MICGNPSKELSLASEYKYLLSKIRPLIEQLDKSKGTLANKGFLLGIVHLGFFLMKQF